jgi:hypothetical protein
MENKYTNLREVDLKEIEKCKRLEELIIEQIAIRIFGEPTDYSKTFGMSNEQVRRLKDTIRERAPSWANAFYDLGVREHWDSPYEDRRILYLKIRD